MKTIQQAAQVLAEQGHEDLAQELLKEAKADHVDVRALKTRIKDLEVFLSQFKRDVDNPNDAVAAAHVANVLFIAERMAESVGAQVAAAFAAKAQKSMLMWQEELEREYGRAKIPLVRR